MQIYILITKKCNLRCGMCIRGSYSDEDMAFDSLLSRFRINFDTNDDIVITGGEPTLHKDFLKFVKLASQNARSVSIATNGTLDYYIDKIKEYNNVIIQVSLDGTQNYHDKLRGNGVYAKVEKTLRILEDTHVPYCIASTVNRGNVEKIKNLIPYLSTLKSMRYWRISYEMPFGCADKKFMLNSSEWNDFVDKIIAITPFRLLIKKLFAFELYDRILNDKSKYKKYKSNRIRNCGNCSKKIYVYPDFEVYPCTCLTDFPLGNLLKNTLRDILENEKSGLFINHKLSDALPCNKCRYYEFCYGGCIGMSYNIFGNLYSGDIRCPILERYFKKRGDFRL